MTFDAYARWLGRGRAHQTAGRPIDALLCYRRALREAPQGVDAQFHVGEIAWHMGNRADAIAAWRSASEHAPRHVPSSHALADALAANGEFEASRDAARRVLAAQPNSRRVQGLIALLDAALGEARNDALTQAARVRRPWPLPLLGAVVLRALESRNGQHDATLPAALLDACLGASVTRGDEDWLRRISLAFANARDLDDAHRAADRYASACQSLYRSTVPMRWPLRAAGRELRLGILVAPGGDDEAAAVVTALAAAGLEQDVQATTLVGAESTARGAADGDLLAADFGSRARAIASLDLDVLIDVAGVRAASGALLAMRPARSIFMIERPDVAFARALGDRMFDRARSATWIDALRECRASIASMRTSPLAPAELAAAWTQAVDAHRGGDVVAAQEGYARILEAQPLYAPALYLTGVLARSASDGATARTRFQAAIDAAPDYVDARVALATSLIDAGESTQASAVARAGLDRDPASATLWRALGQAELARGDAAAAAVAFEKALVQDGADADVHYNHGVALQTLGSVAEAARAYQRALAFRPELHAAEFNLGVIFDSQGNRDAAIHAYSNVLARAPDHVAAYKARAEALLAAGRIDAWFENFDRFEAHCPDRLALAVHALEVCAYRGDFSRLARYLDGLRDGRFTADRADEMLDALQQLLYLLHFFDIEPELLARYARTHDELARTLYGEPLPRRAKRRPGRLRVGYLSGDFRNHVMGKMMLEVLERHDRERFEIFAYATTDARDDWTPRFVSAVSSFESLGALTDADAASRIANDDLDVLVDLSTHTKGARPGILARKPARVQITHVASAGTLGMSAIEFKLTDRYADVEADRALAIEALLPMEGCVYPYRHVAPAAARMISRERVGIAPDAIAMGAFVTPLKLSQRCLALWHEVLARVPQAVIAFSPVHPGLQIAFERVAARAGIDASRLAFVPQGRDDAQNQARYRLIDFVLDPLPYGGVNGTLEALDMGVPVVTLVGRRHAERTSFSILANLGVTETIAQTGGDYVDIAVRLATDRDFMRVVRERIADRLRASPLTDMAAHTRNLEAAYVRAVEARAPEALRDAS